MERLEIQPHIEVKFSLLNVELTVHKLYPGFHVKKNVSICMSAKKRTGNPPASMGHLCLTNISDLLYFASHV